MGKLKLRIVKETQLIRAGTGTENRFVSPELQFLRPRLKLLILATWLLTMVPLPQIKII